MGKQIVVNTYDKTLLGHKKELSADSCYNLNKSRKHYVKKPVTNEVTKGHILYHSF